MSEENACKKIDFFLNLSGDIFSGFLLFLDSSSLVSLSQTSVSLSILLARDDLVWKNALLSLPLSVKDTGKLLGESVRVNPQNWRPLVSALVKKTAFTITKKFRESERLGKFMKPLSGPSKKNTTTQTILSRVLSRGGGDSLKMLIRKISTRDLKWAMDACKMEEETRSVVDMEIQSRIS